MRNIKVLAGVIIIIIGYLLFDINKPNFLSVLISLLTSFFYFFFDKYYKLSFKEWKKIYTWNNTNLLFPLILFEYFLSINYSIKEGYSLIKLNQILYFVFTFFFVSIFGINKNN